MLRSFFPILLCILLTLHDFHPVIALDEQQQGSAFGPENKMEPDSSVRVAPNAPRPQSDVTQLRAKRASERAARDGFSLQSLLELLLCFFLPPAAVALHGGSGFKLHILLNVLLCILGWVPGILHAVWYCFIRG